MEFEISSKVSFEEEETGGKDAKKEREKVTISSNTTEKSTTTRRGKITHRLSFLLLCSLPSLFF